MISCQQSNEKVESPMQIDVCAGANGRFMIGATAAFASLALNAKQETLLHFHIFTENVKPEPVDFMRSVLKRVHKNSEVIEHICDDKLLAGLPYWAGSRLSAARVFYPYILKDLDWVLYVDCDVLYFASPEEHFLMRNNDSYVCVTQEEDSYTRERECAWALKRCGVAVPENEYFNAGIMLFNLKKCREDRMPEKIQQFYKDYPDVELPDQTAMNVLFNGKKTMLPPKYDRLQIYISDEKLKENPVIHFVSGNPWLPKLGVVANGRFRLWHRFCDKYIWEKKGYSYKKHFPQKVLFQKRVLYFLLKCRSIGALTARILQSFHLSGNAKVWREQQVKHDCSEKMIKKMLEI